MLFVRPLLCASALFMASGLNAYADMTLDVSHQKTLSLTIYQNGLGFVRDLREASLKKGLNSVAFEDVSSQLIADSLLISGSGFRINERRFSFDVLNPRVLLEKSIGKEVAFLRMNPVTGKDELIKAKILSTQGQVIIERDGHIEVGQPGRLVLNSLPDGLRARPALLANLETKAAIKTDLALAYLTNGLNWNTSYSAELNDAGTSMTLHSWANLTNTSNLDYKNVELSLAAGSVNRRSSPKPQMMMMSKGAPRAMSMDMGGAVESMAAPAQALGGIHLYALPNRLDLNNKETKQVALMPATTLKTKRVLVQRFQPVYGTLRQQAATPLHPNIELSFTNNSKQPLPDGLVRLYRKHSDGKIYFIGEDRLQQTPKDVKAKLHPGKSFDITLLRKQTEYTTAGLAKNNFIASYEVTLKNAKKTAETVRIEESFPGEWDLKKSNHKLSKQQGNLAIWEIEIPAGGEETLSYRVHVRRR